MSHDDIVLHVPSGEYPTYLGASADGLAWVWFAHESEPTLVPATELEAL